MPLTPGQRVGPFEILQRLGAGGMGTVHLAYDTRLDRRVALKELRAPGEAAAPLLLREARAAARLSHARIAALYDVLEVDGTALLVMEYVEGETLSALVKRGPLAVDRVLDIGLELADALVHAHAQGIIHADIKPGNVMATPDGHVKLLDLGIARVWTTDPGAPTRTSTSDPAGVGPGTPAYMAPEQLTGQAADAQSDIYSLGALLFEIATGRRAYDVDHLLALAMAVASGPEPRASRLRPDLPAALDDLIARAMARDPRARFPSAVALREALADLRDRVRDPTGQPASAPATRAPGPRATRRWWGAAAVVVTAAVVIGATVLTVRWSDRSAVQNRPAAPIAILPAINLAGDPATGELGASLVAILTSNLSAVPGVTVASHAAVTGFQNPDRNVATVARELGAGYVVDLSIGRVGDRVRVAGRLLSASAGDTIWQDTVEGDALAVHREVIDHLAAALESAGVFHRVLTASDRARVRALPTTDAQALLEYARGAAALDRAADVAGFQGAADAFGRAIARDATFALAHAGLAQAYASLYAQTSDPAWVDRAAAAAGRALELDPAQSAVHASLARVYLTEGQLADAEQHARVAVSLAPGSDDAHRLLGRILAERGAVDAGLAEVRTAIGLRPDYWVNHDTLGYLLYRAARYEDAIAPYRRVVELRPGFAGGYQSLGTVLHYSGRLDEANGNYEHALRLGPEATAYSSLAFGYYSAGRFSDALENYTQAIRLDPTSPVSYYNLGDTYLRLHDAAPARRAFEQSLARTQARLAVNPNDARLIALAAVCEAKLGRLPRARQHAGEAAALKTDDSDVVYKLAVVQALGGEADAALATLGRAIALGYPRAFARSDWDLQSLAARDEFKMLTTMPAPGASR